METGLIHKLVPCFRRGKAECMRTDCRQVGGFSFENWLIVELICRQVGVEGWKSR